MRIRLGGTQDCFGKPAEKPKTGDDDRLAERGDIGRADRLLYAANALMMAAIAAITLLIWKRR